METIFENIGFKIKSEDDVYKLADYVLGAGKVLPLEDGAYSFWEDESGAQVWLRLKLDHEKKSTELMNIDPHFRGGNVWELRVSEKLEGEQDDFLDGKYLLETLDGSQFIAARVMGSQAIKDFAPGKIYNFQLAMIPHGIKFFESETSYREYYGDEKTVPGAIIPRGVYSRRLGGDEIRREEILLTSVLCNISHVELKHICATGEDNPMGSFWHLTGETMLGTLDIAAAAEEDLFDHQQYCLESGQAVVSVYGTIGALVVVRKEENQE